MSFLGGFLFGNVNEEGNIDDDFFDEEIKETLAGANLSSLGLDLAVLNDRESSSTTSSSTTQHASNAVDFSDIQEVADDDFTGAESVSKKDRRPSVGVDETTDEEDFLNEQAVANSTLPSTFKVPAPIVRGATITTSHQTPYKSSFPSNRDRISDLTPSSMQIRIGELPDELQAIFPSFERNKILNFSDLFMPTVGLRNPPQSDVSVQIAKKHFTTVQDTRSLFDSSRPDSVRVVPATSQILEVLAQKLLILGVLPADLMDYIESWDDRDDTIKKLILVERYLPESPSEYFPVVLENWEDKIVWDSDTLPDAPIDSLISEKYQFPDGLRHIPQNEEKTETSIFPVKNYELEFGSWTDSIMWDDQPTNFSDDQVVELDMNDPFLQFDLAKFVDQEENATTLKFRRASVSEDVVFDRFNLSNDNYYDHVYADKATTVSKTLGSLALQHAVPAVRLARSLYKTYLTKSDLRRFHRPHIRFSTGETITISKTKLLKKKKIKGKDPSELMKHVRDLTLRDTAGFVLAEFSEEFPPVMSKPGMASLIYNYYRKKSDNDTSLGETKTQGTPFVLTPTDASPFLGFGDVAPGQTIQTLYNNLFRAPIFQHEAKTTDYLLIKWKLGNEVKYFVREIPALFVVGQVFPMVEIPRPQARLNKEIERNRIKVQAIRLINQDPKKEKLNFKTLHKSFNYQTEIQLRQRIKEFMEAWKKNQSTGLWKLKGNQKLLSEEELRGLVTPEMVCLYEAMKAGQQQLSDAGYADNSAADNADVEDTSLLSVEQQLAPWMTSRHYLMASQGKAMVEVHGAGDPTGRGEGFSFVKRSMKGMFLRAGETEEDRMKDGERSRVNVNEQWEVYREEINRIWNAQLRSLNDPVPPPVTEDETEASHDIDESGSQATSVMSPMSGPSHSRTADWDDDVSSMNGSMGSRSAASAGGSKNKYMVIKRLIRFENGQTEWRSEIVRDPKVINAYVRQRQLIDTQEAGLEQFEPTDKAHENERRKRKLEAQIRKLREAQERKAARKAAREAKDAGKGKKRKELKCSACGEPGHIKTNKVCPKFQLLDMPIEETVKVEGTKISINKAVLQRIGSTPPIGKRKRDDDDTDDFEYSMPFSVRSSRRRHADVELSDYFEKILVDVIGMPESFPFRVPVSIKQHPDYYTLIKTPKDLSMIREDNKNLLYRTAASFLAEFDLIIANCEAYNGQDHYLTGIARSIGEKVARELKDNESYISRLESEIVKELELTTQPTTANASPSSFSLSQDFQSQSLQSNSTITPPSIGNAHSGDGTSNGNIEAGAPHGVPVATSNRNPVTMDMSMSEDEINVMD